jgi:hypoxanthine-DNA glycosylase
MVKSSNREVDSSIEDIEVNDIVSLLEKYDTIEKIAFTGRLAQNLYKIHFDYLDIESIYLPSPSSAYAKMSFENKIETYRKKLGIG